MIKTLHYSVTINASKEKVWNTMIDSKKYNQWAKAFSADSQFDGQWKQGAHINFIDPAMGGTKALLEEIKPHDRIHARHIAMINKDGSEDRESEVAKKWIGTTETYTFQENNGLTELFIETRTDEAYEKMFSNSWPKALELLKALCEE